MKRNLVIATGLLLLAACSADESHTVGDDGIDRVEPPFWWAGFKHPELQLLVRGDDLAGFTPSVATPGVSIARVERGDNPDYLFVYLDIGAADPGTFDIVYTNGDEQLVQPYELREREPGRVGTYDSSDVIYLITPDRFANGDPANDNVDGYADRLARDDDYGRHGGDLEGVRCISIDMSAPDILTAGKPHLGTNRLTRALLALNQRFNESGVDVRFGAKLEDLLVEDGRIHGAMVNGEKIDTDAVFLATGHSARDVYRLLERCGAVMEARPFAVGARVEHPQALINRAQLGTEDAALEPADYMLTYNPPRGSRSAYSFCMCPGGEVVAAGTEADGLTVNGMSYSNRAGEFANAAVVVTVGPEDFGGSGPLAGLDFQRRLELAAFEAGGGPCGPRPAGDGFSGRPALLR